jgi:hypothetical protein
LPDASIPGAPLQFGIYPGGVAGSVAGKADPKPEDPDRRDAALSQLRGSRAFSVHIYGAYTGDRRADEGTAVWLDGEIARYTGIGLKVELVMRFKPVTSNRDAAVSGFADAMRDAVRRYGEDPGFTSLQVTNEANLTGQPDASDGAFPGALDALVAGVVAAKDETRKAGRPQVRIGFNWASDARPAEGRDFWTALGRKGGKAFSDAVDWVGLDAYPGTFYPALPLTSVLPQLTGTALSDALRVLRRCHMPRAGLGADVPLHVSENGFPTGAGRSYETQAAVLEAMVRSADSRRGTYNVSDFNWFDLRDGRTGDTQIENQYGLMRDDYTAKPAFWRYRDLVAGLGAGGAAAPACRPSPVKVALPRPKGWRVTTVRIRRGSRLVKTVRRQPMPSSVPVRLAAGTARLSLRVAGRRTGRSVSKVVRRTYTVCAAAAS